MPSHFQETLHHFLRTSINWMVPSIVIGGTASYFSNSTFFKPKIGGKDDGILELRSMNKRFDSYEFAFNKHIYGEEHANLRSRLKNNFRTLRTTQNSDVEQSFEDYVRQKQNKFLRQLLAANKNISAKEKIEIEKFNDILVKQVVHQENLKHVFVLKFNGDMVASQVCKFKEQITAIVQNARPDRGDSVVILLNSPGGTVTGYFNYIICIKRICTIL